MNLGQNQQERVPLRVVRHASGRQERVLLRVVRQAPGLQELVPLRVLGQAPGLQEPVHLRVLGQELVRVVLRALALQLPPAERLEQQV